MVGHRQGGRSRGANGCRLRLVPGAVHGKHRISLMLALLLGVGMTPEEIDAAVEARADDLVAL